MPKFKVIAPVPDQAADRETMPDQDRCWQGLGGICANFDFHKVPALHLPLDA
jgi:hypothetical protein